jgi:hypothetical protein
LIEMVEGLNIEEIQDPPSSSGAANRSEDTPAPQSRGSLSSAPERSSTLVA